MHEHGDMTGSVCLITGATSGIGLETARALASLGATVYVGARNRERGEEALDDIRSTTGSPHLRLAVADLEHLGQVRAMAAHVAATTDRLDVLINNAGAIFGKRVLTPSGHERTFAVNHLAHFLLTNVLLDLILRSAPARIINVSSNAHHWSPVHFDDLHFEYKYNEWRAYAQSKLANVLFTYELARRLEGTGVTVNCMHPGYAATGFNRRGSWMARLASVLGSPFKIAADEGADTVVFLAASEKVAGTSGEYFYKRETTDSSDASYDEADQRRLWEVSEQLTGLAD